MTTSDALETYRFEVQNQYTAIYLASWKFDEFAERLKQKGTKPNNKIMLGSGPPESGSIIAKIGFDEVLRMAGKNGDLGDMLAKSFLVLTFARWDEHVRSQIAAEHSDEQAVSKNQIKSDVMGELRHIRNCIVHENSVITGPCENLQILSLGLRIGERLVVSEELLKKLFAAIYNLDWRIEPKEG